MDTDGFRLTLDGGSVLVENHRGITEYSPGRVAVRRRHGSARIDGEALSLTALDAESLLVTGRILAVTLE